MKLIAFIYSFILCICFSSLYANQRFNLQFANPQKQQTVFLKVTVDNSSSLGDGFLYYSASQKKIKVNDPQTLIPKNTPYSFYGTTRSGRTYIVFTLMINHDTSTQANFRLTSGMGTNPVGLNCYPVSAACQDYTISSDPNELTVN